MEKINLLKKFAQDLSIHWNVRSVGHRVSIDIGAERRHDIFASWLVVSTLAPGHRSLFSQA